MDHQIANKLVAVVVAVLMNGMLFASVSYLFSPAGEGFAQARAPHGTAARMIVA